MKNKLICSALFLFEGALLAYCIEFGLSWLVIAIVCFGLGFSVSLLLNELLK
jgi:uncharacterized membrane protein